MRKGSAQKKCSHECQKLRQQGRPRQQRRGGSVLYNGQAAEIVGPPPRKLMVPLERIAMQTARITLQPGPSPLRFAVADDQACFTAAGLLADVAPHGRAQRGIEHSVHAGVDGMHDEGDGCGRGGVWWREE